MAKLPNYFKSLFWSYEFSSIDPKKHYSEVIMNTLNYGNSRHLKWIIKFYGKKRIRKIIQDCTESAFKSWALETISETFGITKFRFKTRAEKIHYLFENKKVPKHLQNFYENVIKKIKL